MISYITKTFFEVRTIKSFGKKRKKWHRQNNFKGTPSRAIQRTKETRSWSKSAQVSSEILQDQVTILLFILSYLNQLFLDYLPKSAQKEGRSPLNK
jgi:hypothetical protein